MKNLVMVMTVVICGYASAQATSIEGNWGSHADVNGINFDMTFSISKNSVTVTNVCSAFGETATAQVTVASSYTENTLVVLEAKQDEKSSGTLNCNVGAQPDQMNYVIQGNQLIFTHAGSNDPLVLIRK